MAMSMRMALALECSVCGQSDGECIPDNSMPRNQPGGEISADFCIALGICPSCNRVLSEPGRRLEMRRNLIALGWNIDPVVTTCPPASAALPFDWM